MNEKLKKAMAAPKTDKLPTLKDLKKTIPQGGLLNKKLRGNFELGKKPKTQEFDAERLHKQMFKD